MGEVFCFLPLRLRDAELNVISRKGVAAQSLSADNLLYLATANIAANSAMIHTEKEYNAIVERIEILLQEPENIENENTQGYIELNILSNLVADYERQERTSFKNCP
ncbi:hypothetical protein ACLI09_07275 [Flavobacterium sp. RHBU_24]|uniref:hypothetical protein n=1 Tax=Flavobacterium sp. RHBU_24 TaxID=3391185 RepID=UPI0039847A5D